MPTQRTACFYDARSGLPRMRNSPIKNAVNANTTQVLESMWLATLPNS